MTPPRGFPPARRNAGEVEEGPEAAGGAQRQSKSESDQDPERLDPKPKERRGMTKRRSV
jgi:hypothetical protein